MRERATAAQLKEETYKDKVEELTTALTRAIALGGKCTSLLSWCPEMQKWS
jgi:hypothetical protein